MEEQNNPEEEEYEEEEIEVYEEVEVDEEAETSDIINSKKASENKENINTKKNEEIIPFTDNTKHAPLEIKDANNENIYRETNNNTINNTIKKNDIILDSNNDNINTEFTENKMLEEKIKNIQNNSENHNLNNNEIKENRENFNKNVNNNDNDDDEFNKFIMMSGNDDFNFELNNKFNFNNNLENKYLNLDYKIIPGRESLDYSNEVKIPNNFEKKEAALFQNQNKENYFSNNINNNILVNNNGQKQPLPHRSKIRRNNKKNINNNFGNYNTNINNVNYNNAFLNPNFSNTMTNQNINRESYYQDNEISRNNFGEGGINNDNMGFNDRFIKSSLNDIITSKNDYMNNIPTNNMEINNHKILPNNMNVFNPSNNLDNIIKYNDKNVIENFNDGNNIIMKNKGEEIIKNEEVNLIKNDEGNMIYNPLNINISQNFDYNEFENKIKDKEKNINEKELNSNYLQENDLVNIKENNNEEKNNINEEEKDLSDNIKNKKKIVVKKSNEEIQYETIILELFQNNEIINLLDSRKWEEKKQGFIKLNQMITQKMNDSSINENNFENIYMYIVLKLNNFKETNFNILKEGILCLNTLFSYYKGKKVSIDKKYLDKVLFGLNEKITDSKLKDSYIQLLNELIEIYSNKSVYDLLFQILLTTNKITVLKEYSIFLRDNIKTNNSINDIDLKNLIDFSVKIANHTNPQIRSISIEIICLLYKFVGPDLKKLISGVKEATMKLIEKELEKISFNNEDNDNNTSNKVKDLLNNDNKTKKNKNNSNTNNSTINTNSSNLNNININVNNNKRIDISKEITQKLIKDISRGKWVEKKEGIEYINSLIDKTNNKISKNGLQDLFDLIKEKLNDGNINLVKMIIQLLSHLIIALETQIKSYSKNLVYPLLLKLSDKNKQIRDECVTCLDNWIKMQNFEIFAVFLPQLLMSNENFEMRNEILNLLNKNKQLIKNDYPKPFFKELTKAFLICLQDKNASIRNTTEELIKDLSNFIPREKYILELKDMKRSISDYLYNILDKVLPRTDIEIVEVLEENKDKENKEMKDKEVKEKEIKEKEENEENNLENNETTLHHQQLLPNKKNVKKIGIRINKKPDAHSMDKNNYKTNKKELSFIQEMKNKNALNTTINTSFLDKNKDKDNLKNNKKKRNKLLSCDKISSNMPKKDEKGKFNTIIINTENTTSRNINTLSNKLNNTSQPEAKKPNKKARNRSTVTDKRNNEINNSRLLTNYYTKKDNKSLTAEKSFKNKKKLNIKNYQNLKINVIKELPNKKVNPKKFLNHKNSSESMSKNKKGNQIFLESYKIKKGVKEKRLDKDKKSNFCFEVQNFDYLPKVNEILKTVFTQEFILKLFSNDLKLINVALTQLKNLIDDSLKNENEENFNKLIDNLDLILKVIAIKVSSNQTASLIKSFFIFADTLINSYKIKSYSFNDTEVNILLNVFSDKLINNNLILKETACNLIWFLNDQIDSSKTFMMLIHLFEYKNAKLKSEIIDIIIKLYDNSNFDINVIYKVLKNLIRVYFDGDFNSKKKVLSLLQSIYEMIGDEFWKYTKFLASEEREELIKYLMPENENEQRDTSREYDIDDLNSSNFGDDDSENNEILNNINKENKNENNNIFQIKGNNYDFDNEKHDINNTANIEKKNKKHKFKRSITAHSKKENKNENKESSNVNVSNFNTNIITSNISDMNNTSEKNVDDSKCISEKELKEALDILINPEEDMVEAIINIHYITFRNYIQNKKVINSNADNIINSFIEITNKLFSSKPIRIKIIKYYILVLCKLCNIKEFIINISVNTQKNLIILILSNLLLENLNTLGDNDEGMVIWRSLNSIISHIIEFCEVTKNISIIIELEQKYRKEKPKLAEYSARCLVIITQNIKNTYKNIDFKKIFNNIHLILEDLIKDNSGLQLKEKTDQTIIITLRNLINELVKAKMDKILDDYNDWIKENNINEEKYILNWIKEILTKIKKLKNIRDEDKNNNIDNNENLNNNKENEQITMESKGKPLDEIKKKWKELQEKNNLK